MDKYTQAAIENELEGILEKIMDNLYYPLLSKSKNNLTFNNYILNVGAYDDDGYGNDYDLDLLKILYNLPQNTLSDIYYGLKNKGLTGFFQALLKNIDNHDAYDRLIGSISGRIISRKIDDDQSETGMKIYLYLTQMHDDMHKHFISYLNTYNKYPWSDWSIDIEENGQMYSLHCKKDKTEYFYTEEKSEEAREKIAMELCYIITEALSFNHDKIYDQPDTFIGGIKVELDCKICDELYEAITWMKPSFHHPEQKTIEIKYKDIMPPIVKFLRKNCRIEKNSDAEIELYSQMGQYAFLGDGGWKELIDNVIYIFYVMVTFQLTRWLYKCVRSYKLLQGTGQRDKLFIKSINHSAKHQINYYIKYIISDERAINDEVAYKGKLFLECGKTIRSDEEKELFDAMFMLSQKMWKERDKNEI